MKKSILIWFLYVTIAGIYAQSPITQVEYFLDSDNGFGNNTLVAITPNTTISENILATIPPSTSIGYHKLYFRTKDTDGNWSKTTRTHIEIIKPQTQNNVIVGEYYLDSDPTYSQGTSFVINPQSTDITQDFISQIPINASIGYHKLYGRVKDVYENWSHTFRKNIEIIENNGNLDIVEIEYFFGSDLTFGNSNIITVRNPQPDHTELFQVPYPAGPYNFNDVLYVRTKDSYGKWSHTTILDAIDTGLNTNELEVKMFSLFPNPVKDVLHIKSNNTFSIETISIYDMTGKNVYKTNKNKQVINISTLSSGIYLLKLNTSIGNASYKILKQ
ncbi:T9SS type A sorting domain-containing protein [Mariniflexile soesokkakense]|uniref:T9SS type A sorting domain-containing protein n=1 Tax=Mariniflexile soesokkakense TaxID=1343160 RepID=A0ABV0A5X8_9FLAO